MEDNAGVDPAKVLSAHNIPPSREAKGWTLIRKVDDKTVHTFAGELGSEKVSPERGVDWGRFFLN
jgi:hypothetical protein